MIQDSQCLHLHKQIDTIIFIILHFHIIFVSLPSSSLPISYLPNYHPLTNFQASNQLIHLAGRQIYLQKFINVQMLYRGLQLLKKFLRNIDLFGSAQLLRYNTQTNYSTLTGGCLSLVIIIVFGALLIQNSISVFTKGVVIAQDLIYYVDDPTYTTFQFDNSSNFIIGVGINGLNLSAPTRHFDITLTTEIFEYGHFKQQKNHTLQKCQEWQWAHINNIGKTSYDRLQLSNFLCPTSNVTTDLEGKFTSPRFSLLRMRIGKCNNETDPSRPCEPQSVVSQLNTYNMNYYFMNAFVNSGTSDPVGYYLEDRDYFGFTLDSTIVSNIYLTENIISTDQSLLPWSQVENEAVLVVRQLAEVKNSLNFKDQYLNIYLRKSPYYILSQRSFVKTQDLFSSIGGLFGFALTFLLFMQFYTQASFQIEMGGRLFYYKTQKPLEAGSFNFIYFLAYCVFDLFKFFNIQIPWERMITYYDCREEVKEQLDLSLLMNKITFLQKCMNVIFEEHQYRAIFLQQKPNVVEAKDLRKNHGVNKLIHKKSKKINDKVQDKVKSHLKRVQTMRDSKNKIFQSRVMQLQKDQFGNKNSSAKKDSSDKQKIPFDLMQLIGNIFTQQGVRPDLKKENTSPIGIEVISQEDRPPLSVHTEQAIQIEEVAGQNHQSLQFVHTVFDDIRQIKQEAEKGNELSKRIYEQLNNDITKQQMMSLKFLQAILQANKSPQHINQNQQGQGKKVASIKSSQKPNLMQSLMMITFGPNKKVHSQQNVQPLQIELQIQHTQKQVLNRQNL